MIPSVAQFSNLSRSQYPQSQRTQGSEAFFAVSLSTPESPT